MANGRLVSVGSGVGEAPSATSKVAVASSATVVGVDVVVGSGEAVGARAVGEFNSGTGLTDGWTMAADAGISVMVVGSSLGTILVTTAEIVVAPLESCDEAGFTMFTRAQAGPCSLPVNALLPTAAAG